MPTQETDDRGLGAAVKDVTEHASTWFRLERELAILELKKKVTALGVGIGLGLGAAVIGLFGLGFLFATSAAALDTFMPRWLSLLIVTLFLFAIAGVLGVLALGRIKKGTPPVPEQALQEAKLTTAALKDGRTGTASRSGDASDPLRGNGRG
ncbi:MAG: phage holin family protein [Actinobacteria bacterium]|nr:phage holin family protein [Actinomycetota bacterium]